MFLSALNDERRFKGLPVDKVEEVLDHSMGCICHL